VQFFFKKFSDFCIKYRYELLSIISASILFIYASINNIGYYHPDEHFQIIEFANYKMGYTAPFDLAWEFGKKVRPSAQPYLCFSIFEILELAGFTDPYLKTTILRIITSFFAIFTITRFSITAASNANDIKVVHLLPISLLLWYVPFLGSRFSSETWSGLLFLTSLTYAISPTARGKFYKIGLFFGLSFLFRYQTALMCIGLLAWLCFFNKIKLLDFLQLLISTILIVLLGILFDYLFYSTFVLTAWNYFKFNILNDGASGFGTLPWYTTIQYVIQGPLIPFGLLIFISLIVLIRFKIKHYTLWCFIPLFIVHTVVPHKELRFLFPLVFLLPMIVLEAFQSILIKLKGLNMEVPIGYAVHILLGSGILINIGALFLVVSQPAGDWHNSITQCVSQDSRANIKLYYYRHCNPYRIYPFLREVFYENQHVNSMEFTDIKRLSKMEKSDYLVLPNYLLTDVENLNIISMLGYKLVIAPESKNIEIVKYTLSGWPTSVKLCLFKRVIGGK
jgi:phosphatidylinositol glycan class B